MTIPGDGRADSTLVPFVLVPIDTESRIELELRALDRMKNELLRTISHNLRSPLATLRAFAELLSSFEERLSPEQRSAVVLRIAQTAAELERSLAQLADLDALTNGGAIAGGDVVDLSAVASRAVLDVDLRGRSLDRRLEPVLVAGDRVKLGRVVHNLLDNCVRHTPERSHVVMRTFRDGGNAVLEVADDGDGIGSAAPPRGGRLGLGLRVVAEIVALHGGEVHFEDAPDGGAIVRVSLPAQASTSRRVR